MIKWDTTSKVENMPLSLFPETTNALHRLFSPLSVSLVLTPINGYGALA